MKNRAAIILTLATLLVAATGSHAADPLGEAARKAGRPLVADFGQNLCKQCVLQSEAMDKFRNAVGDRIDTRFVHVVKEAELTAPYKIVLIPTLIFYDRTGKEVFRQVGYMPFEDMMSKAGKLGLLAR